MLKVSKGSIKTLASYHGISVVRSDCPDKISEIVSIFLAKIMKRAIANALKRTTIEFKRLLPEDVESAITTILKREPLTVTDEISPELSKLLNKSVENHWRRIMKVDSGSTIHRLVLHRSSFHAYLIELVRRNGYNVQIGSQITTLLANEVEFYLFGILKSCASAMNLARVETLNSRVINHVLDERDAYEFVKTKHNIRFQ